MLYNGLIVLAEMAAIYALVYGRASRKLVLQNLLPQHPRLGGLTGRAASLSLPEHQAALGAVVAGLVGAVIIVTGAILRRAWPVSDAIYDSLWAAVLISVPLLAALLILRRGGQNAPARHHLEQLIKFGLMLLSAGALLTTFGIVFSLLFDAVRFFAIVPVQDFIFGTQWSPQTAIRADQTGQSGAFGALPVLSGTFLITLIAISVAGPVGLMIAIYLSEYAKPRTRRIIKPTIEILAGIPTVVYGFFALLTVGPAMRRGLAGLGFDVPAQSAISAGLVMGIMIIPLVSSLSDDVINAVPQSLRDGSYALGATKSETMKRVVFVNALPGIVGAFLLAISRAIGETMIVVMAAGRAANLSANPFDSVTTVTVQIVTLLTGDQEFDSAKTLAAFALGFVLFGITLILNFVALNVVRRYSEPAL